MNSVNCELTNSIDFRGLELPRREAVSAYIDGWLSSEELWALAAYSASTPRPRSQSQDQRLDWLSNIAASHWDFRRGRERDEVEEPRGSVELRVLARKAAESWGMLTDRHPQESYYDFVLVLGGLARGSIARARFVSECASRGLSWGQLVGLTAERMLAAHERRLAPLAGARARTEQEVVAASLADSMGVKVGPSPEGARESRFNSYSGPVLVAEIRKHGGERADTADTLAWFLERFEVRPEQRILAITSSLYVPYQATQIARALATRAIVDVAGPSSTRRFSDMHPARITWHNYLQEIKAALDSMTMLTSDELRN